MKSKFCIFLTLLCFFITSLPHDSAARAGAGRSMGSRGTTHTYQAMPPSSSYRAAPIQRSVTPQQTEPHPQASINNGVTLIPHQPLASPSFFSAHPLLTSMAGGFLGAGLFSTLFGHSAMAASGGIDPAMNSGSTGGIGFMPLLIIGGLLYFAFRYFRRSGQLGGYPSLPTFSSAMPQANATSFSTANSSMVQSTVAGQSIAPLTLTAQDYQDFRPLLEQIQTLWGATDTDRLNACLTPEMQHYFSQELAANSSRGLINKVEQVKVLTEDLIESWSEDVMDYATLHMKWSAVDYRVRSDKKPTDPDYIADGSPTIPVEAEEIWTFIRANNGGRWLLSAIQQVA